MYVRQACLKLTCVDSLVDLEVLRARKYFSTSRKGAGKGFLSSMNSDVVDQLVLGLEWLLLPGAVLPVAGMVGDLRTPNVLHSQVVHYLWQGVKKLVAHLSRVPILPQAQHLLLDRLPHVAVVVGGHVAVAHVVVVVAHVVEAKGVVGSRGCRSMEAWREHGVIARVHISSEQQLRPIAGHRLCRVSNVGLAVEWVHLEVDVCHHHGREMLMGRVPAEDCGQSLSWTLGQWRPAASPAVCGAG